MSRSQDQDVWLTLQSLAESAHRAFTLETRMRETIRSGGFMLHYQPQVRVSDGGVIGVDEAVRRD